MLCSLLFQASDSLYLFSILRFVICFLCLLKVLDFVINDLAVYAFLCIGYDFIEKIFYGLFLVVEGYHSDFCSLPFVLIIQL